MKESRTVRLFLSSTFRDFGEERDLMVKRVFPALRARLADRFVELVDVDLRWGITVEEAERGKVLPICLAEIDRARPFFVGMLGERYGWVPPAHAYAPDLIERQPWLDHHRGGKSVTELEILHGVLNEPKMAGRAFFYFRSREYARAKAGEYLSTSKDDGARQSALKESIRKSGFPVVRYPNPEAFAKHLERDLWKVLDAEFPAESVPDAFERERLKHEAYAAPHRRLYIGGGRYQAALIEALQSSEQRIVVEGDSGGGKSALLANFFPSYRRRHPKHLVYEHYLGASADAADPHALVRRLVDFVKRHTDSTEVIAGDPQKLMDSLPRWLATASAWAGKQRTRFIFVLDSINSLTAEQDLRWWPALLPKGVTMVVSCLPGAVLDTLKGRKEPLPGQDKPPKWKTIGVRPLTRAQSAELLNSYLARFNKKLSRQMVRRVQAHALSSNPLFTRTLAEELRLFGLHEKLQQRLEHYLSSDTIGDLFERVLHRVEDDCGKKAVRVAMTAIWASRAGLTEKEILAIADLTPATWAAIRNSLDQALLEADGRITFAHEYVRIAVGKRYRMTAARKKATHLRLAKWFAAQGSAARRVVEEPWQLNAAGASFALRRCLLSADTFLGLWTFSQTELLGYWRHRQSRELMSDYERAFRRWCDPAHNRKLPQLTASLADAIWESGGYGKFGAKLQVMARQLTARRYGALSLEAARRDIHCAHYLHQLADPACRRHAERAVKALERGGISCDLLSAYIVLASYFDASGEGWQAKKYATLAVSKLKELPDTASKIDVRHDVLTGWFFWSGVGPEAALPVLSELVDQEEQILGREHRRTLETVDCQVGCLHHCGKFGEAANLAMSLYLRCYRVFGEKHLQTGYAAGKYGKASLELGDLEDAEWGLSKAVEILKAGFPPMHQSRIVFHDSLANCLERMGDPVRANAIRDELHAGIVGRFFYQPPSAAA